MAKPSIRICRASMGPKRRSVEEEEVTRRHCEPTGRRQAPPDDKLREAIQGDRKTLDCFVASAPRNDECGYRCQFVVTLMKLGNLILALAISGGQTLVCAPSCHCSINPVIRPLPYFRPWVNWSSLP